MGYDGPLPLLEVVPMYTGVVSLPAATMKKKKKQEKKVEITRPG
jgi:hypothetical protein